MKLCLFSSVALLALVASAKDQPSHHDGETIQTTPLDTHSETNELPHDAHGGLPAGKSSVQSKNTPESARGVSPLFIDFGTSRRAEDLRRGSYKTVTSGSCGGITSKSDCEAAATELVSKGSGQDTTKVTDGSTLLEKPPGVSIKGCYYSRRRNELATLRLYYNPTSVGVDCSSSSPCLCKTSSGTGAGTGTGTGTGHSVGTGSSSSTTATATATSSYAVKSTVKLAGISATQFATEHPNFKEVIASYLSFCGSAGTSQCTHSDVTIHSASRRDVSVEFSVKTTSQTKAATGANTLNAAITTNPLLFVAALVLKGGNLASVTGSTTTSAPTVTTASSSSAGRIEAGSMVFSLVMALAALFV